MDMQTAKRYFIPAWDCPNCGGCNEETGQDDIVGENIECPDCGTEVEIEGD